MEKRETYLDRAHYSGDFHHPHHQDETTRLEVRQCANQTD